MLLKSFLVALLSIRACVHAQIAVQSKNAQLNAVMVNTSGQVETTGDGVMADTSRSLRAGPRGYNLLEDTTVRKKLIHFGHERTPERVVHALGHGAYGTFESYGDWSNMTSACWLKSGAVSELFVRFSVVVSSAGGSESARDTHGFATKIYSECGNQDFVGNHVSSFFINDGALFPDLVHSVKYEPEKGFPTTGSAHTTAYSFFAQRPEGAFQLMNVLSDLGIPRDVRHIRGNGVHTYRFINDAGESQLFKWYWLPKLGHRSVVYDEALTIAGKNNNFQRVDLYNNIEAGIFPEWEFAVQLFPDDGTFMWQGIDLLDATSIVPFELNNPIKLGKMTLNRNPTNYFAEPESISFAPSTVVDGISFVPDPLLQWRLMSYDDTSTHRHNSANGYLLPINKAIAPVYNNYRDGYMQPLLYEGASTSTPNDIDGVQEPSANQTLQYTSTRGESAGAGHIGRYLTAQDWAAQARTFWGTMDIYAQQHTVDAYRFELGHVSEPSVVTTYINTILNPIDNCLARRVAFGIGAAMPAVGSGGRATLTNSTTMYPNLYPLNPGQETNKSNAGLVVGIIAVDDMFSAADMASVMPLLAAQQVTFDVVASHVGSLASGVNATSSFILTASVFYDAILIGSPATNGTVGNPMTFQAQQFILEAWSHGKAIGSVGASGMTFLESIGLPTNPAMGIFNDNAEAVTSDLLDALSGPVRFPQRFPVDDASICQ